MSSGAPHRHATTCDRRLSGLIPAQAGIRPDWRVLKPILPNDFSAWQESVSYHTLSATIPAFLAALLGPRFARCDDSPGLLRRAGESRKGLSLLGVEPPDPTGRKVASLLSEQIPGGIWADVLLRGTAKALRCSLGGVADHASRDAPPARAH